MTSQFRPGKDLRKGNQGWVTSEKRQGQLVFPVSKTFSDHKRTKLCFNQYFPQHIQHTHRQEPNGSSPGTSSSRMNLSTTSLNDSFLVILYYNVCSPRTMSRSPGVTWILVSGLPKIQKFKDPRILWKVPSICLWFMKLSFVFPRSLDYTGYIIEYITDQNAMYNHHPVFLRN